MRTDFNCYIDNVLTRFTGPISEDITDRVFLMIESNPQLLGEYKRLTSDGRKQRHTRMAVR